jgi:hypothetical protein
MVETIAEGGVVFGYIVRGGAQPSKTTFYTPDHCPLQVGRIVYAQGGSVPRHYHRRVERHLSITGEVFLVQSGSCAIDIYSDQREKVSTFELEAGDVAILIGGGHAMRMHEDTVLLEIKQGPYGGPQEKELF